MIRPLCHFAIIDQTLLIVCRRIVVKPKSWARAAPSSSPRRFCEEPAQGEGEKALGEIAGLHRTYVGSVERGERNITFDSAECLAQALGLRLVDLLVE